MNRQEFERLRDLPGKKITQDIRFISQKGSRPNLVFDGVPVENEINLDVVLNGTYKPEIPAIAFNFVLKGSGPICRIDINGTIHKGIGRNHKHELQAEGDSRLNLPYAIRRNDLVGKTPTEVWELLCIQANIVHTADFINPDGGNNG